MAHTISEVMTWDREGELHAQRMIEEGGAVSTFPPEYENAERFKKGVFARAVLRRLEELGYEL